MKKSKHANKTKVTYRLSFTHPLLCEMGAFMADMDLGIGQISAPETYVMSWITDSEVDSDYLYLMSETLTSFYVEKGSTDFEILNIETEQL